MKNKNTVICVAMFTLIFMLLCLFVLVVLYSSNREQITDNSEVIIESEVVSTCQPFTEDIQDTVNNSDKKLDAILNATDIKPVDGDASIDYKEVAELAIQLPEFEEALKSYGISSSGNIVYEKHSVFSDFVQYTYSVQNTDGIFIVESRPDVGWVFLDITNRYDSEYPIIEFTNGVPSNAEYIYELCLKNELYWNYTTDYSEGEVSIELYDSTSTELITVLQL